MVDTDRVGLLKRKEDLKIELNWLAAAIINRESQMTEFANGFPLWEYHWRK